MGEGSAARARRLLDEAERTNHQRDADELGAGFTPVSACPPDMVIRTAISALECGLKTEDWSCVAEATVMLADLTGYRPWLAGGQK